MKKIIIFSFALMISSVSFAQNSADKTQEQIKCEEAKKDEKNKNFGIGGKADGSSHFCTFNRMFGSSHCQGLGGTFKKAIFRAGTCTIGTPE